MSQIKLIVGLCNPGEQYKATRHNAGAWLVQQLAAAEGAQFTPNAKFFGEVSSIGINDTKIHLLLPSTFMNDSGKAVQAMAHFYKLSPEEVLVVHDEIDLPPGVVRLKQGGGDGGHNGLKSVSKHLSPQYHRLRLGVGHPGHRDKVHGYVLSKPRAEEENAILDAISFALQHINDIIDLKTEKAQQKLHTFKA